MIDRLTAVDKVLFSEALRGFFSEIRSLEARVGHRVLCPHVLKRVEPKLAYITKYECDRAVRDIVGDTRSPIVRRVRGTPRSIGWLDRNAGRVAY